MISWKDSAANVSVLEKLKKEKKHVEYNQTMKTQVAGAHA